MITVMLKPGANTLADWRAIYRHAGNFYVILAIDRHKNFASLVERAQARVDRYDSH